MAEKGLGAGLGALFGDISLDDGPSEAEYLPISRIEPRQDQPRQDFDEEALAELSESIREHGIIQPIVVRAIDSGYYQIIAGERRWRAARQAGLTTVPVRVLEADDMKAMELALVENLQRENLNPIEEAAGYKVLMTRYSMTQDETAKRVGKSRPVVANALRLLTLPEDVIRLVQEGALGTSQARAILELEGDEARSQAAAVIAAKDMTVREATSYIKRLMGSTKKEPEQEEEGDGVDYFAEVEKDLTRSLGRKVKIVKGRKKGRIEIDYYGPDDFEVIQNALKLAGKNIQKKKN